MIEKFTANAVQKSTRTSYYYCRLKNLIVYCGQQLFIHSWMKAVYHQRRHIYLLLLYLRAIEYAVGYRKLKGNALKAFIFLDPLRLCCLLYHYITRT